MKKIIVLLSVLAICFSSVVVNAAAREKTDMIVEGKLYNLDVVTVFVNNEKTDVFGFSMNDRTYVPLRAICEALKCEVQWDPTTETATISNEITRIKIQRGNTMMTVRDRRKEETVGQKTVTLDVAPVYARQAGVSSDSIMVPARHVAEALNAKVIWNEQNYIIYIISEYDEISNYLDGYAIASKSGKYGFINNQGQTIVKLIYDKVYFPSANGLAAVCKNNRWGFVNMSGNVVVEPRYDTVKNYSEGLAAVCLNKKWGFIDSTGKTKISETFDSVESFSESKAVAQKSGKYGYINTSGTTVIDFVYDDAKSFSDGYAAVCKNGKWGYVDKDGNLVIACQFDSANEFYNGKALVKKGNTKCYINTAGVQVY